MKNPKARFVILAVPCVVIMALASYVLAQAGGWGVPVLAAVASGLFALLVIAFAVAIVPPGRRRLHEVRGRGGVGLSNSPVFAGLVVAFGVTFYLFVLGLVVLWAGSGDRPVAASGPLVLIGGVAVAGVPTVIALARGRFRLGGLLLTPEKVSYSSYATERSIRWEKIMSVDEMTSRGGAVNSEGITVIGTNDALDIPCGMLHTNTADLLAVIRFSHQHPRARTELADARALSRLAGR